jgi:hypothetical protein
MNKIGVVHMTNLQELIDTASRLSQRLEMASNDERKFCVDIQFRLEQMSWEIYRTANELKEINNFFG